MIRTLAVELAAAVALLAMVAASLSLGSVWMDPHDVWRGMVHPGPDLASLIVVELREPRTLLGIMVGATLGLCGAVLQALLRNPLAEPGLLGVSPGGALGGVLAIFYGLTAKVFYAAPVCGMIGALAATALTFAFGRGSTLTMILAGAAVASLASAGIALALNFAPNAYGAYEITTWLMGSITDKSWEQVKLAAPFILAGWILLASTARPLDALSLGEAQAESLGIDLNRLRGVVLLGVALCVGACTSVSGSIGFIGLAAPHLVRPLVGHQPSRTLVPSALLGAVLLLGADICTRLLRYDGAEIKLGVLTALIGAPFFFALVVRLRKLAP